MHDLPLLVDPEWLASRLGDPDVRVIDASWYLPSEGIDAAAEYARAHLPSAVRLDLSSDLADTGAALRNAAPEPEELAARFGRAGIGSDHRVVVYDRRGGYSAGRIWWLLRYAGHPRAALLDGGLGRWVAEGRPLTAAVPGLAPARFAPRPQPHRLARKADLIRNLETRTAVVVDARSAARFRGEGPESAARAGHIPDSINVPYAENLAGDPPRFLAPDALRRKYEAAGVRFERPVVTTCGSGVTAALDAFALELAGHASVSVYDGSWDEWGNADDVPVATGD